jgi:integrase
LGQDVIAEKRAAQNKAGQVTLGEIVPKYLAGKKVELRARSYAEVSRHINKAWKPLHKHSIAAITRADIVSVIDAIEVASGKVAADRARTSLSTLFAWAIDRGHCDANPTLDIKSRAQDVSRSRVLSESEIAEVWHACLDDDYGRIVRLLILTGQRKTEIGDLSKSEVDLDKQQIDLPGERTRNGRAHIVPLCAAALAILKQCEPGDERQLLFGKGEGGFSGWSKAKVELDSRIAAAREAAKAKDAMPAWVIHDLRRSFVTHMNERGIAQPHVIEAIVNHVSGHLAGVAGVYNKAQYLPERRNALEVWAEHIRTITQSIRKAA